MVAFLWTLVARATADGLCKVDRGDLVGRGPVVGGLHVLHRADGRAGIQHVHADFEAVLVRRGLGKARRAGLPAAVGEG